MSTQAAAPAGAFRVFNPTIASITLRGLLGRKRSLLLIPLPLILVGLSALAHYENGQLHAIVTVILLGLGVTVVLPLTALIIGTSVVGSEIDDGTIVHILTKPLPRREILLTKYAVAAAVSAIVVAVPMLVSGAIVDGARLGIGLAIGSAIGALVYSALFVMASLLLRRAVLACLAYILLWEGLLGNVLSGIKVLSVEKYVTEFAAKISGTGVIHAPMSLTVAIVMAAVLTVLPLLIATDRLRSFSVAGETS